MTKLYVALMVTRDTWLPPQEKQINATEHLRYM